MNNADTVREKLLVLESRLKDNLPNIKDILRDIHSTLKNDPDVVTILTEDEVAILVNGLIKQTQSTVIGKVLNTKKSKKDLQQLTLDDL